MLRRKRILPLVLGLFLSLACVGAAAETTPPASQKLSLEDCLKLGLANSLDLQTAAQNIEVAQESISQAQAVLGLSVNYSANHIEPGGSSSSYNNGSISVNIPAFSHNKLVKSLKVAQLNLESAREDERQTKLQLIYDIKNAFYALWLKEQKLSVAQSSYENFGQHYQTVKKYLEVGKKSPYELLESEVAWKQQKANVISAESDVSLAKLELATVININKDQDLEIVYDSSLEHIPAKFQLALVPLLEKAYQQRPDIHKASQNLEIAQLNVAIVKGNNIPSLTLSASQTDLEDSELQLTLAVSGTLYDNKKTASEVRAAGKKVEIAKVSEAQTKDLARQSVQKVYQNLQVYLENAIAYKANIALTKEALRMTNLSYAAGKSTILDVKDAQLDLDEAQNNYFATVNSYITYLAQLDLELGNLGEK